MDESAGTDVASRDPGVTGRLFGDRVGLALFLGSIAVTWLWWHVGFFIADTYTMANTLVNLAEGHLRIDHLEYSLTLGSLPGLHVVDATLYGRNYGQAVLALPIYLALEVLSAVVEVRLLIPGVWSLVVVGFARTTGGVIGRQRTATGAGAVVAVAAFASSVAVAQPFERAMTGIVALQILSTVTVAAAAVLLYRTLLREFDRRVAAAVGAATVLATPLWFWGPIPKRHALTAAAVAALLFAFAHSRDGNTPLRAAGYALGALVAWIHVFEGVALLGVYAVADLATAGTTGRREVAAIALVLALALSPMIATNVLVSGNPAESPRLTPNYDPDRIESVELGPTGEVISQTADADDGRGGQSNDGRTDQSDGTQSGGESTGGASDGDNTAGRAVTEVIGKTVRAGTPYARQTIRSLDTAPNRLYSTYVRSGRIELGYEGDVNRQEPIDLTLLESVPILGTLGVGLVLAVGRLRRRDRPSRGRLTAATARASVARRVRQVRRGDPGTQTGLLAVLVTVAFATMYLSYLPLHSQITVRYILPTVPALVYLVARLHPIRRAVREATGTLVASYAAFVLAGLALVALALPHLDLAIGEAMQLHALVNLGAALVATTVVLWSVSGEVDDRAVAAALALPAAATTVLVTAMQVAYFEYGRYAIPAARLVADLFDVLS